MWAYDIVKMLNPCAVIEEGDIIISGDYTYTVLRVGHLGNYSTGNACKNPTVLGVKSQYGTTTNVYAWRIIDCSMCPECTDMIRKHSHYDKVDYGNR